MSNGLTARMPRFLPSFLVAFLVNTQFQVAIFRVWGSASVWDIETRVSVLDPPRALIGPGVGVLGAVEWWEATLPCVSR